MNTAVATTVQTRPEEQETIVRHLSERVRSMLAGDAVDRKRIQQRRPSKVLQLGVLPPEPPPDPDRGTDEIARRRGEPPSTMGLDFVLKRASDGRAAVELEAEFSVYVQRYPSFEEQRDWWDPSTSREDDEGEEEGGHGSGRMRLKGIYERFDVHTDRIPVELDAESSPDRRDVDLADAIAKALGTALTDAETVYPFKDSQTLPESARESKRAWDEAIHEAEADARQRPLPLPKAEITLSWRRSDDALRVQAILANKSIAPVRGQRRERGKPRELARDLHLFNCKLRVYERDGSFRQQNFAQAPEDFRYTRVRSVWAMGYNCVGRRLDEVEDLARPLTTETWPLYRQRRMLPRAERGLELSFAELAEREAYLAALSRIRAEMTRFEGEWRQALDEWSDDGTRQACAEALEQFREDIRCYDLGLRCLSEDPRLERAFVEANEVFRRQGLTRREPIEKWRLFQIVYQVIHLAALRARESDAEELAAELDTVDVLWFPTGGGKTEAYLGLITCALFYDRLRGKERGVAAILRFPLRMLSVQQLQRVLAVLWFAERRRREIGEQEGLMEGDPFALGYWVGSENSPNTLVGPEQWRTENIEWWKKHIAEEPDEALKRRILTRCPNPECAGGKVELEADVAAVRLRHVCRICNEELPVYVSDEEVYRYLPAVLVCTVDKLAHIARADHFTHILAGPAYRCPEHGYFTWHQAVWNRQPTPIRDDRCLGQRFCTLDSSAYEIVPETHDPGPTLQVQDELHLLEEELGTFNAHYETLMEEMQRSFGSGKPAKLLAATATIEAYDEQVRQLYARRARVFPTPGWDLERSFYTTTTDDARRLYVGALPYRPDAAEFGERVQELLHLEVIRMQDHPSHTLATLGINDRDEQWLQEQLFLYELTLGYVNRKPDADRIQWLLKEVARRERMTDELDVLVLTGGNKLAEIADALERIETERPKTHTRADRLRALVATSIVSHGVDIDRLNLMVMNGMTPAVADYIQASSRSGRTHVGLVIVGYDRRKPRDVSFYRYFLKYHEFIDRLIAPVPVNRFAKFAVRRTLPGVLSALLIQVYGRKRLDGRARDAAKPTMKPLSLSSELRRWWQSTEKPDDKRADLTGKALTSLGLDRRVLDRDGDGSFVERPVFDPGMVDSLRDDAEEELDAQLDVMQDFTRGTRTPKLFQPEPLTSFRDVDEPIEFAVSRGDASRIEDDLTRVS